MPQAPYHRVPVDGRAVRIARHLPGRYDRASLSRCRSQGVSAAHRSLNRGSHPRVPLRSRQRWKPQKASMRRLNMPCKPLTRPVACLGTRSDAWSRRGERHRRARVAPLPKRCAHRYRGSLLMLACRTSSSTTRPVSIIAQCGLDANGSQRRSRGASVRRSKPSVQPVAS